MIGLPSLRALDGAPGPRIWLAAEATDMRCGFDRLAQRVHKEGVGGDVDQLDVGEPCLEEVVRAQSHAGSALGGHGARTVGTDQPSVPHAIAQEIGCERGKK